MILGWIYCLLILVSGEIRGCFFRLCCLETEPGYTPGHIFAVSFVLLFLTFHSVLRALFMGSSKIFPYLTFFFPPSACS